MPNPRQDEPTQRIECDLSQLQQTKTSSFPSTKPARRPREIERAAEKFVSQQVDPHLDVAVDGVDSWVTNIVNSFYEREEGMSSVASGEVGGRRWRGSWRFELMSDRHEFERN